MRHKKEVDRLLVNMTRLDHDPAFRAEIEKLSEIVTPTEEDLREICTFM